MSETIDAPITQKEARLRLGLGKRDCLADYLPSWLDAEERLAKLVVETDDLLTRAKYEADLKSLRQIIEVLRNTPSHPKRSYGMWVWAALVAVMFGAGLIGYLKWVVQEGKEMPTGHLSFDDQKAQFTKVLEIRRWSEAEEILTSLSEQDAPEDWISEARAQISQGQAEEQGQQVGFLIGNAQAALEAGRLTDARQFCDQIEKIQPDHPKLAKLRSLIDEGLLQVRRMLIIQTTQNSIEVGNWQLAEKNLAELIKLHPDHAEIARLRSRIDEMRATVEEERAKANELLTKARQLDNGTYSAEALSILEEAMRIAPNDELRSFYKKVSAYGRALKVPSEYKTIAEAIQVTRENDRILLAKGTYQESLTIPAGIEIIGESRKSTIIEYEGAKGSVITLNQPGKKSRIASLTLRHRGLVNENERYPVVAVSGARLQLEDSNVSSASGHGIAVINGGTAELAQCEISQSGWDGIVVQGGKSSILLANVTCRDNLHNGLDFWEGGSGRIEDSQFLKNGRSGIYAIEPAGKIEIISTRSEHNRQLGFYLLSAPSLSVSKCEVHQNLLGGILIEDSTKQTNLLGNKVTENGEVGIAIERGVQLMRFEGNVVEQNKGKQVWKDAIFPEPTETESISVPPPPPALQE